jgi:DNA-binding winged helix-turn-helix (wHTH) protein/tetratricopeptide (TPR) repeat protein
MPSNVSTSDVVRFGVFEADLRSGELRKSGIKVKIQELPFQALKLLLSRPNDVLSRDDMRKSLWPDGVFVDFDRGVISAINRLRDALGDSADNPVFIETVGRRGYRWIAPTQSSQKLTTTTDALIPEAVAAAEEPTTPTHGRSLLYVVLVVVLLLSLGILWSRRNSKWSFTKAQTATSSSVRAGGFAGDNRVIHAANRESEDFYLKGRYYWEKRTPESLTKAVDAFTQSIVHDPTYAPAYVGLADCYNLLREYTLMPSSEAYPRALAAAKKAVELDPRSSEAHASLAFVSFFGMWDAATADREFRRAIELDPTNAIAHHWYASYLTCLRRYTEALTEIERARAIDPASKSVLADQGSILACAGRLREGLALLEQMATNEPDFISPHRYLKSIYLETGDYPRFIAEAKKEAALMHDDAALDVTEAAEKGLASGGGNGLLEALRLRETESYERGLYSPYFLARTYALMGRNQEALQYLRKACEQHSDGMTEVVSNHIFDALSKEPVFQQILAQIGLPQIT